MVLDRVCELIQSAIDQTDEPFTVQEVLVEIQDGKAVPIIGERSIMVCSLHKHHDQVTGHVWLGAGDLAELKNELRPKAEEWARANGATTATISGRAGWARALAGDGFEVSSVTVRKTL